ncbi:MAG: disulfide reductase [Desulfobacca sp.]|nr:disulfide reductase [Desulfobacca sp.]
MRYSLFPGCKIPYYLPQYETASRLVLGHFGLELEDLELNCCGHPIRFLDFKAFIFSSARNIALAGQRGLPLLCLCKCCYGTLRYADLLLRNNDGLLKEVNGTLKLDGLHYPERLEIKHLLNVLYEDIVPENILKKNVRPFPTLKVAAHYGCHILRPSDVVQFDNPFNPNKFEKLVEATGAASVDWSLRTQCCGESLWEKNNQLSLELSTKKIKNAQEFGADLLCVACTHCQIQFDRVGETMKNEGSEDQGLPSILYPQLLGLGLGLDGRTLGIDKNVMDLIESRPSAG